MNELYEIPNPPFVKGKFKKVENNLIMEVKIWLKNANLGKKNW